MFCQHALETLSAPVLRNLPWDYNPFYLARRRRQQPWRAIVVGMVDVVGDLARDAHENPAWTHCQ
jgi:hypothetical protein